MSQGRVKAEPIYIWARVKAEPHWFKRITYGPGGIFIFNGPDTTDPHLQRSHQSFHRDGRAHMKHETPKGVPDPKIPCFPVFWPNLKDIDAHWFGAHDMANPNVHPWHEELVAEPGPASIEIDPDYFPLYTSLVFEAMFVSPDHKHAIEEYRFRKLAHCVHFDEIANRIYSVADFNKLLWIWVNRERFLPAPDGDGVVAASRRDEIAVDGPWNPSIAL